MESNLQSALKVACSKLGSLLDLNERGATLSIPEQVVLRGGVACIGCNMATVTEVRFSELGALSLSNPPR